MKAYERVTKHQLQKRTYTIIRVDGRSFHNYTKNLNKPFDHTLTGCMGETARALVEEIQGAKLAYFQSDEISIVATDFDNHETEPWFGGIVQKVASVSASVATAAFNNYAREYKLGPTTAQFDSRVFSIPSRHEVVNYLIWRQQDAERNSLQMFARSIFSHKQLDGKNSRQIHDMLHGAGENWNNLPEGDKRGRCISKEDGKWKLDFRIPIFTKDRDYIESKIPKNE